MNETHATKYLLSLPHTHPNGTAERARRLLEALGTPQKNIFVIKILGEAGKSSASSLLASLLSHGRIPQGSVTLTPKDEPRLAIQIDKAPPSHKAFSDAVTRAWNASRATGIADPSYEEILLAASLSLFSESGCRVILVELRSNSRLSVASALPSPRLCLLTATAREKAAELMPLIDTAIDLVSAPQEPSVYRLLTERAAVTHCRLSFPTKNDIGETSLQNGALSFTYQGKSFSLPTLAHYQKSNALAVIEAYHALVRQGLRLTEQNLTDAFSDMSPSLCFRFFSLSPAWLIDSADTPMRLAALAESVERLPALFGESFAVWTEPSLKAACRDVFGDRISHIELLERGTLHRALKKTRPPKDSPLLIVGSEAFTAEAHRALGNLFLFQ